MTNILDQIRSASARLHPTTLLVLADMYGPGKLRGTESDELLSIDEHTRVSIEQGAMLNTLMRDHSVERSLEIGLAYGFSTVWMLDALCSLKGSAHTAVDPFQKTHWGGIGLAQAARLEYAGRFEWIPDYSIHALSRLIHNKRQFDFIYIDGNHRFDDVIVDFYLADQIMRPGGLIVLDDMWMNSIRSATNFIINNRAYELLPQPVRNISVLRKIRDDDRSWEHFVSFEIHDASRRSRLQMIKSSLRWAAVRFNRVLNRQ